MKTSIISKLGHISEIGALALAALALWPVATRAADIHWQGPTASYTNAADWVGGVLPGSGDNAINDNGTGNAVQINVGDPDWTVGQIRAGNSAGNGAFVQNGQTVTPLGTNYNGPVISEFFTPFRLGVVAADAGVYTLNGGTLNYGTGPFDVGEVGTGTLNINGGTITGSGVFYVNSGGIAVPNPVVITATAGHGPYLGDYTYFEQGYYTPDASKGIPAAGSTVNNGALDHSYTLAPSYTAPNAVVLDAAVNSATITLATPTVCSGLSFLCSAGNGPATNNYTVHYASGADDTGTLIVEDWFFPQAPQAEKEVLDGNGRVDGLGLNFQITTPVSGYAGNPPYLWSLDTAPLANTDKVVSIHLSFVGGGGQFSTATFMGVSGQATVGGPFTPLAISGYNADVVVEAGAPSPHVAASVMDTVTQTGGTNSINQLWVAQGPTAHGTYNLSDGVINANDWMVIGRAGGIGTFNMTGGTFNKANGGNFIIGSGAGDNTTTGFGTFNQSGGTINDANEYWLAENTLTKATNNISGTAVLNLNSWLSIGRGGLAVINFFGGTINKSYNGSAYSAFIVGDNGAGYFKQTGGTNNTDAELWVANGGTSIGEYDMSGGLLNANNWFQVGRGGAALLNFSGGTIHKTSAVGGNFIIGDNNPGRVIQTGGTFIDDNQFWIGNNTSGEYDFTNGTLNVGGELWIGQGGSGSGVLNLNGGAVTNNSWLAIGRESAQGTLNIISGAMTKAGGGNISIAHNSGANGTVNQSGGVFTCASGETWIGENAATGIWNMSGGTASFNVVHLAQNSDAIGSVQLDGGAFIANEISMPSAGSSTFNFNGGTLRAGVSTVNFMHGLMAANVQAGGAVIDSQAFDVTVSQNLADNGGGGLTKIGTGSLTLSGANTYSGPTIVNDGILGATTASTTGSSGYTVANSAGLSVQVVGVADSQFSVPAVTFSSSATTLNVDLNALHPMVNAPLNVTGTLTVNGTVTINVLDSAPAIGTFPLVKYGTKTGAGSFVLGTLPTGMAAALVNNTGNNSIDLHVTQTVATPRWDGSLAGGIWDINTTANWYDMGSLPSLVRTVYKDGMTVFFDDNASNPNVTLNTTVNPKGVTANNSSLAYTLAGSGKITGTNGLVKQGTSTLAIQNTGGNDYTGPTTIAGGTLSVTSLANGGSPSAIGASTASPANLVLAGGALSYAGPSVTINRGYSLQTTNGGTIDTAGNLALSGSVTAASGAGFTKTGAAQLAYISVGSNTLAAADYLVENGTVVLDGSAGGQTNLVQGAMRVAGSANTLVVLTNSTLSVNDDSMGSLTGPAGAMTVNGSSTLTINSWLILGDAPNSTGTFTLNGGTVNQNNGRLLMGGNVGTTSTLNINGGVLNKPGDVLDIGDGNWNGAGARTGTVNQTGGTLNCNQQCFVGLNSGGSGIYNLSGGSIFFNDWVVVGRSGGVGTFNMTGGTVSRQNNGQAFIIGSDDGGLSVGTVNQSGGVFTCNTEYWLGVNGGRLGTNNISGTAELDLNSWLSIGRGGLGVVNFSGGKIYKSGNGAFIIGDGGTGFFTQTGGTNNTDGEIWIAQSGSGVGQYTMSGGVVTAHNWLAVGREGGQGTLNISGGSFTKDGNGNISIGHNSGASGTVNQTGGSFTCAVGETWIGENAAPGIWNISAGTATFGALHLAQNSDAAGTLNLNGGIVTASEVTMPSSGTSTLNFNGGTLVAGASTVNFLHGLTSANVLGGGAVIDSGANVISVAQPLLDGGGAGGLTKIGTGTLYLNGANTYSGPTLVNAGTLGGTGIIAGPVAVAAGAALAPGASIGTLTINNTLTLSPGSTTFVEVSLDGGTPHNDLVTGLTGVAYSGELIVSNVGTNVLVGGTVFKLFQSASAGTGNFTSVRILPSGVGSFNPATGELRIPPAINAPHVSGGNLILTGTGGTAGGTYSWLTSTNVAAPLANWTTDITGVFNGSGGFSNAFPINSSVPARFFQLRTP
jgi:autotransporter-associated beta strand protein